MKINNHLKFVIDTNIFVASTSEFSKYHWILKSLRNKEFDMYISNEVLSEYEEKLFEFFGSDVTNEFTEYLLTAPNVFKVSPSYFWKIIEIDPDDNKFIDCAVAANADYLVTNDKHFNVLNQTPFPKINIINIQNFTSLMKK